MKGRVRSTMINNNSLLAFIMKKTISLISTSKKLVSFINNLYELRHIEHKGTKVIDSEIDRYIESNGESFDEKAYIESKKRILLESYNIDNSTIVKNKGDCRIQYKHYYTKEERTRVCKYCGKEFIVDNYQMKEEMNGSTKVKECCCGEHKKLYREKQYLDRAVEYGLIDRNGNNAQCQYSGEELTTKQIIQHLKNYDNGRCKLYSVYSSRDNFHADRRKNFKACHFYRE